MAREACRAIAEAKRGFAQRGIACSFLAEGATVAERFGRWRREVAAGARVKQEVADAVGDGEDSKAKRAGDGW